MAHPSTEIRNALHGRLTSITGVPDNVVREKSIEEMQGKLPLVNVVTGDTEVTILSEAPREERRVLDVVLALSVTGADGQQALEQAEAYSDLIERDLLEVENLGLPYVERAELGGLSPATDREGAKILGVYLLGVRVTYCWDYPERPHADFDRIVGGIDHDQDVSTIETPFDLTMPE